MRDERSVPGCVRAPAAEAGGGGGFVAAPEHLPDVGPWVRLLGADPRPWLLASGEPSARFLALCGLVDGAGRRAAACEARREALADAGVQALVARLPSWDAPGPVSGHASASFAPNLLGLLADLGLRGGDDERVEALLDAMLERQRHDGRLPSLGSYPSGAPPRWSALPCDSHAITEVLVRFDRAGDPRVERAVERIARDLGEVSGGTGWTCRPDGPGSFRGPGRRGDGCPQVALQALRVFARLPERRPHASLMPALRTALGAWRQRGTARPYMFGHGRRFKTVTWPSSWYDALALLDTLGRFPALWRGGDARDEDRRALAELGACLIAYNVDPDGTVTPRSCHRGFEAFSFGQKKVPSPYATARVMLVLRRVLDLADDIAAVDVTALASSKGGSGTALPPRRMRGPAA